MPKRYAREFRRAVAARLVLREGWLAIQGIWGVLKRPSISGNARP